MVRTNSSLLGRFFLVKIKIFSVFSNTACEILIAHSLMHFDDKEVNGKIRNMAKALFLICSNLPPVGVPTQDDA